MNPRKILLTGGSGALGTEIRELLAGDSRYVLFSSTDHKGEPCRLDVTNAGMAREVLSQIKPDLIFHLAAIVPIPIVEEDHEKTIAVNVLGLENILKQIELLGVASRVVVVSSSEVYGNGVMGKKFVETDPYAPTNFYAWTKVAQEQLGLLYMRRGLDLRIARVFNYSSIHKKPIYSLESFADQIAALIASNKERVIKVGNLEPQRDFLQGADVARALLSIGVAETHDVCFNVSRGEAISMQSLLQMLVAQFSADVSIELDPQRYRTIDNYYVCGENTRLRSIGWEPTISTQSMIEILARHVQSKYSV